MANPKKNGSSSKKLKKGSVVNKKKKESMQRLREEIKSDPARYEEAKRKERERYHARKAAGKIKTIDVKSDREKRKTKAMWRKSSKQLYDKKKKALELEKLIEENSPPPSPGINLALVNEPSRERMNVQRRRRNTRKLKSKIKELEERLKKANKQTEKYRKRAHRLDKIKKDTPTKNVEDLTRGQNVSPGIKRKLLYGEVLSKQLRDNFKDNKIYRKVVVSVAGKVIKKYRFMTELSKNLSFKMVRRVTSNKKHSLNRITQSQAVTKSVREFLEKDEHSRMCPGAKDTVTFKKEKRQKRYLNDSMMNLHKLFSSKNPQLKVSYALFCKLRPFWILVPKVTDRETCLCTVHENMNLLVSKLFHSQVIKEISPREICKTLCCDNEHLKEECLSRICKKCKINKLQILDCDIEQELYFEQWFSKKTDILVKGEKKTCRKTVKEVIKTTKQEAFQRLVNSVPKFMIHINNIKHQHASVDYIKEHLTQDQVLIHIDFSENYGCKYGKEIQSAHFGGSKPQVSLHTVVLYYICKESDKLKPMSLCTVSASLRHDSSAICAHLKPISDVVKQLVPNVDEVHFLSDSVTNQYRNKKMFFLIKTEISKMFGVKKIQWHYSEAGHGKGAPDGIGGCLKRSADSLVAQGKDISNVDSFISQLKDACKGIKICAVKEENMKIYENIPDLEVFKGTLKVHQITWIESNENILQARSLSCLKCLPIVDCKHYGLGQIQLPSAHSSNQDNNDSSRKSEKRRIHYNEVYSSDSDIEPDNILHDNDISIGDWVAVIYDDVWYPGLVEKKNFSNVDITFMHHRSGRNTLYWPSTPDYQNVTIKNILCKIFQPPYPISSRLFKLKTEEYRRIVNNYNKLQ